MPIEYNENMLSYAKRSHAKIRGVLVFLVASFIFLVITYYVEHIAF